jgi:hypothetical protein
VCLCRPQIILVGSVKRKWSQPPYSTAQDLHYSYDITAITDQITPANSQTFVYDHLNRLTSAIGPYGAGGATATLTYRRFYGVVA